MVSTRGARYKFTEGERVLCYEPDPTKAKVLYDSKVLEVIESKDRRGRRTVEYLIHFQGWNSSWDRSVSEDFVLKDTEENRQLQRDLAEKSQLQIGAYLYRRERKKVNSTSGSGGGGALSTSTNGGGPPAKRARHSGTFEDEASSSSQNENDEGEEASGDGQEARESSSESGSGAAPNHPPPQHNRAHIVLHSPLRDRLTFDYHLVVKRGRLSALPASPCVAEILESFVRWFARAGAWSTPGRSPRGPDSPTQRPHLTDVSRRLNLVRETADGLRVYFDHILRGYLLYKRELQQYHELVGRFMDAPEPIIKRERPEADEADSSDSGAEGAEQPESGPEEGTAAEAGPEAAGAEESSTADRLVSPKREPEAEPDEMEETPNSPPLLIKEEVKEEPRSEGEAETLGGQDSPPTTVDPNHTRHSPKLKPEPREESVARRLRSHKNSTASAGEGSGAGDDAGASTSQEPQPLSHQPPAAEPQPPSGDSSSSSFGDAWCYRRAARSDSRRIDPPPPGRNALSKLLDKVSKWTIVPRENTEHLPCRIYGAIHLSRLFVKLPDFLNAVQMPEMKLKLLLQYIDMFVQYLDEHSEWFGEAYYMADSTSRSR